MSRKRGIGITIDRESFLRVEKNLGEGRKRILGAGIRAVKDTASIVAQKAQNEAPVVTGHLLMSDIALLWGDEIISIGQHAQASTSSVAHAPKSQIIAEVIFDQNYAAPMHEKHPTKSKFLQKPLGRSKRKFRENIVAAVGRALQGDA